MSMKTSNISPNTRQIQNFGGISPSLSLIRGGGEGNGVRAGRLSVAGRADAARQAIVDGVVDYTVAYIDGLSRLVNAHLETDMAPSLRVMELNHGIATAVLEWIEQLPSTGEEAAR